MVHSIMTLLENGLEDGEEAGVFDSTYVDVSCAVTSDTNGTTLIAGESFWSYACCRVHPALLLPLLYSVGLHETSCPGRSLIRTSYLSGLNEPLVYCRVVVSPTPPTSLVLPLKRGTPTRTPSSCTTRFLRGSS